jgi:predicted CopG family antitoxin
MKSLKIRVETHRELMHLKIAKGHKTISETIEWLIKKAPKRRGE